MTKKWYTAHDNLEVFVLLEENFSFRDSKEHYTDPWTDKEYELGKEVSSNRGIEAYIYNIADEIANGEHFVAVKAIIPKGTEYSFSWNLGKVRAYKLILTEETFDITQIRKIVHTEDRNFMEVAKPVLRSIDSDKVCAGYLYTADKRFIHPAYLKRNENVIGVVTDITGMTAHIASTDIFYHGDNFDNEDIYDDSLDGFLEEITNSIDEFSRNTGNPWREATYREMWAMFGKNREAVCLAYIVATEDTVYEGLFRTSDSKPYAAEGFPIGNGWPTATIPFMEVMLR